ncbi:hypothetical protein P4345_14420, partial [Cytobacillus horneckiae]|nr:hypothetical protein [Cytobacillus horneckiae]
YRADQLTLFVEFDPFTGEKNKKKSRNSLELVSECGAKGKPFSGPLRPRPVREAFSRRANHQFTLVVLIIELQHPSVSSNIH